MVEYSKSNIRSRNKFIVGWLHHLFVKHTVPFGKLKLMASVFQPTNIVKHETRTNVPHPHTHTPAIVHHLHSQQSTHLLSSFIVEHKRAHHSKAIHPLLHEWENCSNTQAKATHSGKDGWAAAGRTNTINITSWRQLHPIGGHRSGKSLI